MISRPPDFTPKVSIVDDNFKNIATTGKLGGPRCFFTAASLHYITGQAVHIFYQNLCYISGGNLIAAAYAGAIVALLVAL